eukprot:SAG22_NODE_2623_length_2364_cov_1.576600_1_plen_73_part_00
MSKTVPFVAVFLSGRASDGALIGKLTVGLDGLTQDSLWLHETGVVLYDSTGRRSNVGMKVRKTLLSLVLPLE